MNLMDGLIAVYLAQAGNSEGNEHAVTVSGSTASFAASENNTYFCGELSDLTVTSLPTSGLFEVVFQSGATATQVTLPTNVLLPDGINIDANNIYDISIRVCSVGGVTYGLAAVQSWPVPASEEEGT